MISKIKFVFTKIINVSESNFVLEHVSKEWVPVFLYGQFDEQIFLLNEAMKSVLFNIFLDLLHTFHFNGI